MAGKAPPRYSSETATTPDPREARFHINLHRLHEEWDRQAPFYRKIARELAEAKLDLNEAKLGLKVTKARLELWVREDPSRYGLSKVTESSVEATVIVQDEYQEAERGVNKAQHLVDLLAADTEAANQRKSALQDAVKLRLADYFADPTVGADQNVLGFADRKLREGASAASPPQQRRK